MYVHMYVAIVKVCAHEEAYCKTWTGLTDWTRGLELAKLFIMYFNTIYTYSGIISPIWLGLLG